MKAHGRSVSGAGSGAAYSRPESCWRTGDYLDPRTAAGEEERIMKNRRNAKYNTK